jgi:hypothetical protein
MIVSSPGRSPELTAAVNQAAGVIRGVFGWRQVIDRTPDTEADRRADLVLRIRTAIAHNPDTAASLTALWPDGIATFGEVASHTHRELDLIADVVGLVEAEYGVPF